MLIPLVILGIVFLLIAVRQVGNIKLQIWQIMLLGALAAILTFQISVLDAIQSINIDVMVFLLCMFIIGASLEESGYLAHLSYKLFRRAKSTDALVLFILCGVGIASALLLNDTLAIIGTPVMLLLAKKHKMSPKLLLLALCFAVTLGSVMSPIGNPQNLLIALKGNIQTPFVTFLRYLFIPTVFSVLITYVLLKIFYKREFHKDEIVHTPEQIKDENLALFARISLLLLLALVLLKIILVFFGTDFRMTYIAIIAAIPALLAKRRIDVIRNIDWKTLVFFASMFVLMESVWQTGFFQGLISGVNITGTGIILLIGILISQLISNVPLVALFMPLLLHAGAGAKELVALAAGSTLAGNLFILGAASNIIIIQTAEKHGETLTFWEFAKVGIPLTLMCVLAYWAFLA